MYSTFYRWLLNFKLLTVLFLLTIPGLQAQDEASDLVEVQDLKNLSLEELMDIEVTLVAKQPEKLSEVASAVQVITGEDIRRSSAMRLPETLRLLPNLHVGQLNSAHWIVGARGFNSVFSNKLLVMIDGRTVYTPLFAGVFWDVQNTLLEDIDRVEAISGPGGTLWGANAVNGVINVVTKSSKETQGLYLSEGVGSSLKYHHAVRYGGKMGSKFFYRLYLQEYNYNPFFLPSGDEHNDEWSLLQTGFRIDGEPTDQDEVMVQGNFYGGKEYIPPTESPMDGQNILGRWTHRSSARSNFILQAFIDRTWRKDVTSTISNQLMTYDLDFQHRFVLGEKHTILWGLGYRFMQDQTLNATEFVGFIPKRRNMPLYSSFVQDEISFLQNKLKLTVGSKFQHNFYSGFEVQPSVRLAFTPNSKHTVWTALSRAVRAPSRIDVDYYIPTYPVPAGTPTVNGGPNFDSEKLLAHELGYRVQPTEKLSFSLSVYQNNYDDLYSVESLPEDSLRYQIMNGTEGYSSGMELYGIFRPFKFWRLRSGYNYFYKSLVNDNYDTEDLGHDPSHQFIIHSMLDLPEGLQLDLYGRYVSALSGLDTPAYFEGDARLAWLHKELELSLNARNVLNEYHQEYGQVQIPRNFFVKLIWRH